ncbi:MAG TPA: DUF3306 domain-containing protein [Roseomonas sp.]|nr:DUF3306 domain-containing protein [Roseomonas sp.]
MSDEGFLSRWSRRKRAAEAGLPEPQPPAPAPEATPAAIPPPAEEPPFDITTLPPVDSLTIDSDFAAFLRKEVPEALKRAALQKAWTLDPAIRDFIGPADYAWDYNAPDGVPGGSLDLIGDVREMLAQAFGTGDAGGGDPPTTEEPVENEAAPAPVEGEDMPLTPALLAEAPAATAVEAPGPAPRRHGSALPS